MTQALEPYLKEAEQAIRDFEFAPGLTVTARLHDNPAALGLLGSADGPRALEYLASGADLQAEGSSWFLRRALRSLNDRQNAGHLPQVGSLDDPEREYLRPPDRYELG
ncbi:hypothetical protein [Deinococcus sonorensis]|uniref:Uncharacterized protein n=2 Tax=Deinococcus sonorensis TaxID=309891 RepID=A0AAU7UD72_9DEIO